MILKSISLENVRTYKNEIIDFDYGINFLSGDIGSGKSTILMSIEFLLFGTISNFVDGKILLRKGEKHFKISGIFYDSKNKIQVEILRKVKKTKDSFTQDEGTLKINDEIFELSITELNYKIYEIFGFEKSHLKKDKNLIFRYSTYTAQEELKKILFQNDKKIEIFRKIFKITKYTNSKNVSEIYQKYLKECIKEIKIKNEEKNNYLKKINFSEDELLKLKDIQKEDLESISNIQNEIKKLNEKIENNNKEIKVLENEKFIFNENKKNFEKFSSDLNLLNEELKSFNKNDLESDIKKTNNLILDLTLKFEKLEKENKEILDNFELQKKDILKLKEDKVNFDKVSFEINVLKNQIEKNLKEIYENKKEDLLKNKKLIEEIKLEILNHNKEIDSFQKINEDLIILRSEKVQISKNLENILKEDICSFCFQKIDESHREKIEKDFNEKIKNIESNILKNEKLLEKKNKKIESLEKLEKDKKEILEKISIIKIEIEDIKEKNTKNLENKKLIILLDKKIENIDLKKIEREEENFKRVEENMENLKNEILKIKNDIFDKKIFKKDLDMKFINLENLEKEITILKNEINKLEKVLKDKKNNSNLDILNEKNINLKKELNELLEKDKEYTKKNENTKVQINFLNSQKELIKNLENEINSNFSNLKKLEKDFDMFEKFKLGLFPLIENSLLQKYHNELNERFCDIFKYLVEDDKIEVYLDEVFEPKIIQNGYEIGTHNLSGGERSSVALAFKLSLKNTISTFKENLLNNFLILDEPTDGFSKYQIDKFSQILRDLDLKQIIIVSHDYSLKNICDKLIKIEKVEHTSKII